MKNKKPTSVKGQNVTLKDLKISKDPKGGYIPPHLHPDIKVLPTVTCVDPHL